MNFTTWHTLDKANVADGHYRDERPFAFVQAQEGIERLEDQKAIAVDDGDTPLAEQINAAQELLEWLQDRVYDRWMSRYGDCRCVTPEMSCPACRLAAVYAEVG